MKRGVVAAGVFGLFLAFASSLPAARIYPAAARPERLFFESGGKENPGGSLFASRGSIAAGRSSSSMARAGWSSMGRACSAWRERSPKRAIRSICSIITIAPAPSWRWIRRWRGISASGSETCAMESGGCMAARRNGTRPIGLYGYSLGGFLAIVAASDNPAGRGGGGTGRRDLEFAGETPGQNAAGVDGARLGRQARAGGEICEAASARFARSEAGAWRRSSCRAKAMSSAKRRWRGVRREGGEVFRARAAVGGGSGAPSRDG